MIGGDGADGDVVVAYPHQRLELTSDGVERSEASEAVSVGAEVVGEPVAVGGSDFARPASRRSRRGVKRVGVHRHSRMTGCEEPFDG